MMRLKVLQASKVIGKVKLMGKSKIKYHLWEEKRMDYNKCNLMIKVTRISVILKSKSKKNSEKTD